MSDLDVVLSALPRIHDACRSRGMPGLGDRSPLTSHQSGILSHLDAVDPTMVTELADYLGVTPSTMSLNLKRLEAAGHITRERDPADRRVMNVLLTPLGQQMKEQARELDPFRVDGLLRELRRTDRAPAVRGLALLAEAADRLIGRGQRHAGSMSREE